MKTNYKGDSPDKYQDYIHMRADQDAFIEAAKRLVDACTPFIIAYKAGIDNGLVDNDKCLALIKAYEAIVPSEDILI